MNRRTTTEIGDPSEDHCTLKSVESELAVILDRLPTADKMMAHETVDAAALYRSVKLRAIELLELADAAETALKSSMSDAQRAQISERLPQR